MNPVENVVAWARMTIQHACIVRGQQIHMDEAAAVLHVLSLEVSGKAKGKNFGVALIRSVLVWAAQYSTGSRNRLKFSRKQKTTILNHLGDRVAGGVEVEVCESGTRHFTRRQEGGWYKPNILCVETDENLEEAWYVFGDGARLPFDRKPQTVLEDGWRELSSSETEELLR